MTIEAATEIYELLLKTTGALAATLGAWAVYRGLRAAALNLELSEIPTGVGDREPVSRLGVERARESRQLARRYLPALLKRAPR
jgi:hypothetical protein